MAHLWQHPYVNIFKHFNVSTWKKSTKEGEVVSAMDKTLKGTVYRISGSIPAGNYIQFPKTGSQSLGLTGRYMYILFRPIPAKYFVVHVDVATQDNLVVRVSFSNLFKEFKSTSTCLQFPFICHAAKGSVSSFAAMGSREQSGPTPISARWTVLSLDFQYILSTYLNRKYHYVKSLRLCANMIIKNIYTSDMMYDPGITFEESKKRGMVSGNIAPMPREMSFPLLRGSNWHDLYDIIRFPAETNLKPFDSIQFSDSSKSGVEPARQPSKTVDVSRCVSDRVTMINKVTAPKQRKVCRPINTDLPQVGVIDTWSVAHDELGDVHLFAKTDDDVVVHREDKHTGKEICRDKVKAPAMVSSKKINYTQLEPDPILKLKRIVGFGGGTYKEVLWTQDAATVVYPCHAVVVAMKVSNGYQRFFIGHTDKVSAIAITGNSNLLASGQTGTMSLIRVWRFHSGECLAMCKTHAHSLHSLSFSSNGNILCGVGKDGQGKNMVVIWNTSKVLKHGEISVMAKAHTDVDIVRMKVAGFDDTRMVSCGRDNIRLWRVKEGSLRSAPVSLGEHHNMEFTDICFETCLQPDKESTNKIIYACSKSGHILKIDYQKVTVQYVRRLLPVCRKSGKEKEKENKLGTGICINSMYVSEAFCVTGSDDGYLRLWPLDFAHVYLEAEHEGPVTAVNLSSDGLKILAGTITGNLGILDVSSRGYSTIMRSHTSCIHSIAIDPYRKHIATVSQDKTIRVWDAETLQQLYDFSAAKECPCTISYHPSKQVFACGFENGIIRIFNVSTTTMLAEHKQHRGKITGLVYNPKVDYLYSADSLGSLVLYDAATDSYNVNRVLTNTVARGERYAPNSLCVSSDGARLAFIGPSDFTVTVVEAKSLDEVLRIDVTNMNPSENTRTTIDTAVQVSYSTSKISQLLVTTANNKLLKFDARNGRLITEIDHIHRSGCTSISVYDTGKYLATAGDKVIKIWDYDMKLDINFQVFIGHCEKINKILFTPDGIGFISVGEAIYIWDFLAYQKPQPTEGREAVLDTEQQELIKEMERLNASLGKSFTEIPRRSPPQPTIRLNSPGRIDDLSSIYKSSVGDPDDIQSVTSEREEILVGPELDENQPIVSSDSETEAVITRGSGLYNGSPHGRQNSLHEARHITAESGDSIILTTSLVPKPKVHKKLTTANAPTVYKHYKQRPKLHSIAQRRYIAPPNQAGLKLKSVIGYNGNGRNNMVWHQDTGLFAYTNGCIIIIEDLNTNEQRHLIGHTEEISTIALQTGCQVLASASGAFGSTRSQIHIWDVNQGVCRKTLSHHEYDIVCMAFSRDDRFLVSIGDYRECCVVVWSTSNYSVLTTTTTDYPIHDIKWDPFTVNEFSTVGDNCTVLFWLLDETLSEVALSVHVAEVPEDLIQTHNVREKQISFTSLEFGGDSTLYIGSSHGKVAAWDTRQNSCFMHWDAEESEIGVLLCNGSRLLTGSVSCNVRVWSVDGINDMRQPEAPRRLQHGLTMEDEMTLNGNIICAVFDPNLEMGIVGTSAGTLWYINWTERTSIRLVSGHMNKINSISVCSNGLLASGADDGSVRVWMVKDREQALQFQVLDQKCTCLAFAPLSQQLTKSSVKPVPNIVAGFSDGTVRMFDVNKVEMVLKIQPHAVSVTAISFSSDGRMILSGSKDGLIAVSSITTGLTVRIINDHKGSLISNIDVTTRQDQDVGISAPLLWLVSSADRRVSVWSADWSKDFCELVDWLTFPAPAFTPDGTIIDKNNKSHLKSLPPTLACFSKEESDIILYVGYSMQKHIQFYSLSQRKVIRTAALTHWATCLETSPDSSLIAVGVNERLLKLIDYYEGSFQDFTGHGDTIDNLKFSPDGKLLFTSSYSQIFIWEVAL